MRLQLRNHEMAHWLCTVSMIALEQWLFLGKVMKLHWILLLLLQWIKLHWAYFFAKPL